MLRLALGVAGVALVVGGVFAPLVHSHYGDVTSWGGGHGDGVFIVGLAALAFILLFVRRPWPVLVAGVLLTALIAFSFFDMRSRLPGDPLGWGWLPLALGTAGVLAAGLMPARRR